MGRTCGAVKPLIPHRVEAHAIDPTSLPLELLCKLEWVFIMVRRDKDEGGIKVRTNRASGLIVDYLLLTAQLSQ
jgi:hypothetical protein